MPYAPQGVKGLDDDDEWLRERTTVLRCSYIARLV
jgi:hypothetical protein